MKLYIKENELRAIMAGSFEDKRQKVMEAINHFEKRVQAAGPTAQRSPACVPLPESVLPKPLALVATFEHNAVIADAGGGLHRFSLADGRAVSRESYPGFTVMTEAQAKKDLDSVLASTAADLTSGKDVTKSIVELMRR